MNVFLSFNTSGTLPGITQLILQAIFTPDGVSVDVATELTESLPSEMQNQVVELLQRIRDNSTVTLQNLGKLSAIIIIVLLFNMQAQAQRSVRPELIPLPPPMQFIDRILRPCGSGATPFVSAIAAADGDFDITTCAGRSVTVNGTPITPGAGLADPGSNGYVVRTALNTTVARTFSVSLPFTITNANGVAGNTALACPTCVTSAASLTNTAIVTGAGLQGAQTANTNATMAANGNISTPGNLTTGNAGGVNGNVALSGATSGTVGITVAAVAGTWTFQLPTDDGTAGQFLQTDGAGVTSWQTVSAGTTINTTDNVLPKRLNAGAFTDSRISDNGAIIDINSGAGTFQAGDTLFSANGSAITLLDAFGSIDISANSNNANRASVSLSASAVGLRADTGATTTTLGVSSASDQVSVNAATFTAQGPGATDLGSTGNGWTQLFIDSTITPIGTTGAQTIDKSAGSVNFAAAATSLVVTSNKVTVNSIVMCTVATNDTTLKSVQCVPTAGSFTMFANAAATAETRVNFWILNQ